MMKAISILLPGDFALKQVIHINFLNSKRMFACFEFKFKKS